MTQEMSIVQGAGWSASTKIMNSFVIGVPLMWVSEQFLNSTSAQYAVPYYQNYKENKMPRYRREDRAMRPICMSPWLQSRLHFQKLLTGIFCDRSY